MPPKASVKPQVPGEPTTTTEKENEASNQQQATADENSEETVTVSKVELSALMNRLSALEAQQQAPAARQAPVQDLPDADSINPDKIKTSVLTKQGWVVPTGLGTNPAAPKG